MKLIYDFDHTLFDTNAMRNDMACLFEKQGLNQEDFFMLFIPYFVANQHFAIDTFAELIAQAIEKKPKSYVTKRLKSFLSDLRKYLYSDTLSVIMKSKKIGENILLTLGDKDFQSRKVQGSTIKKYFSEIIYTEEDKSKIKLPIKKSEKGVYFINDKLSELVDLQKKYPHATMVWINRYNESPHKNIPTITHLSELMKLIEKN